VKEHTAHVVGVDAGGTSTRAVAVDAAGAVLGTGRAGGANPNAHPPEEAAARIADAITSATAGLVPGHTRACVVGMAGTSKLSDPAIAAVFERTWQRLGLDGVVSVVSDAEAAFASATAAPDGTVLIAGTGSISGRIRKRRLVSTTGGYGWLLGDEGSAYWIGREAVRATLDALATGRPLTGLASAVLTEAFGTAAPDEVPDRTAEIPPGQSAQEDQRERGSQPPPGHSIALARSQPGSAAERLAVSEQLITQANAEPPIQLARFAPLVSAADHAGEPIAREITHRAAEFLVANTLAAREPEERTPVVLVGSVLGETSPVGACVRAGLRGLDILTSTDGVMGAAWLAAVAAFGEEAIRPSKQLISNF
jgi:N-acetylglucosamine kinase-like BadF-type ATPase